MKINIQSEVIAIKGLSQLALQIPFILASILLTPAIGADFVIFLLALNFSYSFVVLGLDQQIIGSQLLYENTSKKNLYNLIFFIVLSLLLSYFLGFYFFSDLFVSRFNLIDFSTVIIVAISIVFSELLRKNGEYLITTIFVYTLFPIFASIFIFIFNLSSHMSFLLSSIIVFILIIEKWRRLHRSKFIKLPDIKLDKRAVASRVYFALSAIYLTLLPQLPLLFGLGNVSVELVADSVIAYRFAGFIALPLAALNIKYSVSIIEDCKNGVYDNLSNYSRFTGTISLVAYLMSLLFIAAGYIIGFVSIQSVIIFSIIGISYVVSAYFGPSFLILLHSRNMIALLLFGIIQTIVLLIISLIYSNDNSLFVYQGLSIIIFGNIVCYGLLRYFVKTPSYFSLRARFNF